MQRQPCLCRGRAASWHTLRRACAAPTLAEEARGAPGRVGALWPRRQPARRAVALLPARRHARRHRRRRAGARGRVGRLLILVDGVHGLVLAAGGPVALAVLHHGVKAAKVLLVRGGRGPLARVLVAQEGAQVGSHARACAWGRGGGKQGMWGVRGQRGAWQNGEGRWGGRGVLAAVVRRRTRTNTSTHLWCLCSWSPSRRGRRTRQRLRSTSSTASCRVVHTGAGGSG